VQISVQSFSTSGSNAGREFESIYVMSVMKYVYVGTSEYTLSGSVLIIQIS